MESRSGKLAITAGLAGLIIAAAIAMGWGDSPPPASAPPAAIADKAAAEKLTAELDRCNHLGPNDKPDQGCIDAWAQAQRHFFGGRP
jgi:conjugative transfer region protein TrbK